MEDPGTSKEYMKMVMGDALVEEYYKGELVVDYFSIAQRRKCSCFVGTFLWTI